MDPHFASELESSTIKNRIEGGVLAVPETIQTGSPRGHSVVDGDCTEGSDMQAVHKMGLMIVLETKNTR